MLGVATAGISAAAIAGAGIIEGIDSKEGADNAGANGVTDGEIVGEPTALNGMTDSWELRGSTAFTWANDGDGIATATAKHNAFFIPRFYPNKSIHIWDLRARRA
jgi:hypothetical protein